MCLRGARLGLLAIVIVAAVPVRAEIYRWVDEAGRVHLDDDLARVPEAQRASSRVFQSRVVPAARPASGPTEGAFAASVARELGLARSEQQDPVSVLQIIGIYPSTGWDPAAPLTAAVVEEVVGTARAAARARRVKSSEATAEAAVLRVASALGVAGPAPGAAPDPPPAPEPAPVVVVPQVVVESPPVVVNVIERPPQPVLWSDPAFAYGVPFAPLASRRVGRRTMPSRNLSGNPGRTAFPLGRVTQPLGGPITQPLVSPQSTGRFGF
jgi:hypothetical protein